MTRRYTQEVKPVDGAKDSEATVLISEVRGCLGAEPHGRAAAADEKGANPCAVTLERLHAMSLPAASKVERRSAMARAVYLGFKLQIDPKQAV